MNPEHFFFRLPPCTKTFWKFLLWKRHYALTTSSLYYNLRENELGHEKWRHVLKTLHFNSFASISADHSQMGDRLQGIFRKKFHFSDENTQLTFSKWMFLQQIHNFFQVTSKLQKFALSSPSDNFRCLDSQCFDACLLAIKYAYIMLSRFLQHK